MDKELIDTDIPGWRYDTCTHPTGPVELVLIQGGCYLTTGGFDVRRNAPTEGKLRDGNQHT